MQQIDRRKMNSKDGISFNYYNTGTFVVPPHNHNYYEFTLITKNSMIHIVNGKTINLHEGALIFVRPDDYHHFEAFKDAYDCHYINIPFDGNHFNCIINCLGPGIPVNSLLNSEYPPYILLSQNQKDVYEQTLYNIFTLPMEMHEQKISSLKALVSIFFSQYIFYDNKPLIFNSPQWLIFLCDEMKRKENFSKGVSALSELTDKSPEHVSRVFKKIMNLTPTQYINDLRLNYCANILLNTEKDITTIAMESGFDNLSHFYRLFKKKFAVSPNIYRKNNR